MKKEIERLNKKTVLVFPKVSVEIVILSIKPMKVN